MYPMMGGGTQKIEMNKRTKAAVPSPEYEAMKNSMLRQNGQNSAMMGAQQVVDDIKFEGAGMALEQSRDPKYGNVNSPGLAQGLMQGTESAMVGDSPGNMPLEKPTAQTGYLDGGVSSTVMPQAQPETMGFEAGQRVQAKLMGRDGGLNNRQELYRRGN